MNLVISVIKNSTGSAANTSATCVAMISAVIVLYSFIVYVDSPLYLNEEYRGH